MTLEEIERLIRHVEQRGMARVEYTQGATIIRLRLGNDNATTPSASPAAASAKPFEPPAVTAPAAGRFRSAHPLSAERLAPEGATVTKGQTIAFLQVGPCLRPVAATSDGVVGAVLVEDGSLVGYGTRLFALS